MGKSESRFLTYMQIQTQTYYSLVRLSDISDIMKSDMRGSPYKRKSELREGLPIAAFTVDGRLFEFEIKWEENEYFEDFNFQWVIYLCYQPKDGTSRRSFLKATAENLKIYFDARPIKTDGSSGKRILNEMCEAMTSLVGAAKTAAKSYPESEIRFLDGDETPETKMERKQNA